MTKALHSFTVRPNLPESLSGLVRLAANLRWAWDRETRDLFARAHPELWEESRHDPVMLLGRLDAERTASLADDDSFIAAVDAAEQRLAAYLNEPRWFQEHDQGHLDRIAYFSPEFGITEALPQYSGGLGVLAGDHLKAASDLGVPLVGIGLFYRHGYFRQSLSVDGWQQERYPDLDPYAMALEQCPVDVRIDLAGEEVAVNVWRAKVGRIPLYLLDTDVDANPAHLRTLTDRLYGGDIEHRLRQEIVLGIGGVRALGALGEHAQLFHTNEGHAGFLGLERIRQLIHNDKLSFPEAVEAARSGSLFTTHTPVPAGIDRFPRELITKYFSGWAAECGVSIDELMAIGHRPTDPPEERFNMAVMGMRLAAMSNGVSALHGATSRTMFADLWPGVPEAEVPITSITNGVHGSTWISPETEQLFHKSVGPDWFNTFGAEEWSRIRDVSSHDVWGARRVGAERLVDYVRARLAHAEEVRGISPSDAAWTADALDPNALTICFARRFATYKRATLLLSQPERLLALLTDAERPIQFIFAGKAHPADDEGKELIRRIVEFSHAANVRHRFAFLDDYDIAVARHLYQGADVWLNNPRRPLEACGTSGEKAALNGALNCSILDGWWAEMFTGDNGWAITSAEHVEDMDERDRREADSLFGLLEQQIVPMFFDVDHDRLPQGWIHRMRNNWESLGPQVTAARMVRDYVEQLYVPLAERGTHMWADDNRAAKDLAAWKRRVRDAFDGVHLDDVSVGVAVASLGDRTELVARVGLGSLDAEDVEVQLLHGPVGELGELVEPEIVTMTIDGAKTDEHGSYRGAFTPRVAGRYGYTVRVLPTHADLANPVELGRVVWAAKR